VAAAVAALLWVAHYLFLRPPERLTTPTTEALPALRQKVERAEEESLIARTRASAVAEEHHRAIEDIAKVPDGKERRARLAALLSTLK